MSSNSQIIDETRNKGMPTVSVITVAFNEATDIAHTLDSIVIQTAPVEMIVIDGGSTDGTVDIVSKYSKKIKHFITEPDGGIFDAMNKGLELASGDWVIFMNSGDRFMDANALRKVLKDIPSQAKVIYGNKLSECGIRILPQPLSVIQAGIIPFCHQAALFRRKMNGISLKFDSHYSIYGDYDIVARIFKLAGEGAFLYRNTDICVSRSGGVSSFVSWRKRIEKYQILLEHFGIVGIVKGLWFRLKIRHASDV